jgi:hypothetical protein
MVKRISFQNPDAPIARTGRLHNIRTLEHKHQTPGIAGFSPKIWRPISEIRKKNLIKDMFDRAGNRRLSPHIKTFASGPAACDAANGHPNLYTDLYKNVLEPPELLPCRMSRL